MQFPSRRTRIALLAGCATVAVAAPASANVTSTYSSGPDATLTATSDAADAITITCDANVVKVNGLDPVRTPPDGKTTTGCAAPKVIVVNGGPGANRIDLSGVTPTLFTGVVAPVQINGKDGNDAITGSAFADDVQPGNNDDTINAGPGNDTMTWNPGEASDVMNGGDGIDTVFDKGGNGDEQFEIKPDPTGKRVFADRINNFFRLDIGDTENLVVNGNGGSDSIKGAEGLKSLITTTMTGGDGNDTLVGTDGADKMSGGPGNDSVNGAKGNDDMAGDEGDDTLLWFNGDGSDKDEGGPGNDIVQDNGAAGNEHFIVTTNGQRVTATRDNLGPFFLDIGTTETLQINSLAGDDSVDVNNGLAALTKVQVNSGDGNDTVHARNDSAQAIDGGAGTDTAQVDATDTVANVENLDNGQDRNAPKMKLAAKALKLKKGKVAFRVSAPRNEKSVKGSLKVIRGRKKVVGSTRVSLKGGQSKTFKVKLDKATLRRIKAKGKVSYKARLSVKDAAGNAASITKKVTLRA